MMIFIKTKDNSDRADAYAFEDYVLPDSVSVEIDDGFDLEKLCQHRVVKKGDAYELVHDPLPEVAAGPSEMEKLQAENNLMKAQIAAQAAQSEFIEEVLAELIMSVVG